MLRNCLTIACLIVTHGLTLAGASEYFSETTKDFGTTPRGPILVHYFKVTNTSQQNVVIGQPRVSCGCTSASVVKNQLAPGESTAVVAQMNTNRITNSNVIKSVTVFVPFLAPQLEEVHLTVQAIARDDLVMSPTALEFGTVKCGQGGSATTQITLYNDANWKITDATSKGVFVKPSIKEVARQANMVTYEISAKLDSECPAGTWATDVWVTTTAAGIEKLRVPVSVSVVQPIVANPTILNLGTVTMGQSVDQKVILQSNQPFTIGSIDDAKGFAIVGDNEVPKPVHVLNLKFTPTKVGTFTDEIVLPTDHKEQEKVSVKYTVTVVE